MAEKAQVRLTVRAQRDLSAIYRRRLAQRGPDGPDGAEALLGQIMRAIEQLAEWPTRGPIPPELEAIGHRKYRQLSLPPFRLIYRLQEEGDMRYVTVVVVADARRDFRALLEERLIRR
ncbi:type II toxin-antitoxin system RelE/ParE family toxin [Rhizorhabdus dicambivorans]|uniref:Type II toxin-antitoxin system RelE/ParE family toxin n=1 Tax=Rhizorhabdus dicambivorans TaxID=1850238 RepID=A0A2A4FYZ2_9SPHN|nr:type II toxin-antitoxin system RelE/ParE family toxin [Rhizorhabdus dicambivorans]ATE63235.1 type II toxin-antitoxin system RelE/ParE family toxin [Rhizorhabdus dicambivorans]PCE43446.1 type II toxin-antitoxin system RelE/ParE family toxin [Rhizorhabdus dicambivorans]